MHSTFALQFKLLNIQDQTKIPFLQIIQIIIEIKILFFVINFYFDFFCFYFILILKTKLHLIKLLIMHTSEVYS